MTDRVVVNRDRTRLLPEHSPQKGWVISRKEAVALGLLESEEKPRQVRRVAAASDRPQRRRSGKGRSGRGRGKNQDG